METNNTHLYRMLSWRYAGSTIEDIEDAVAAANCALEESRFLAREPVRNPEAYRTCVAQRFLGRAMQRQRRMVFMDMHGDAGWENLSTNDVQPLRSDDDRQAEHRFDTERILDTLPHQYAQVLALHYLQGLTLEESAHHAGVTPACMRKRHERALKMARRLFDDSTGEE